MNKSQITVHITIERNTPVPESKKTCTTHNSAQKKEKKEKKGEVFVLLIIQ